MTRASARGRGSTALVPGDVHSVFQPIVDLREAAVVGFEALARGPRGPLESPVAMLAEARESGRTSELDTLLRETALRHAAAAGIEPPLTIFLNADPAALDTTTLSRFPACDASILGVVEITERALASHPAQLLAAVDRLRDLGWGIALDDVGAEPAVAAMLALVEPDVVKLDLTVVQRLHEPETIALVAAVRDHAERTDCLVLAEGIESADHYASALALGADLGQGLLLGEPSRLPESPDVPGTLGLRPREPRLTEPASVLDVLTRGRRSSRRAADDLLRSISYHLEQRAREIGETGVLLASYQDADLITADDRHRYRVLAQRLGLVGVAAHALEPDPTGDVHHGRLAADDPLRHEWAVVVLGPHYAAAMAAREVEDLGLPNAPREFDYHLTFDRDVVVRAARALVSRLR